MNIRNGNTFYIDTQFSSTGDGTELIAKSVRVPYILVAASSAANTLILSDAVTGSKKLDIINLDNAGALGDTRLFDFREYPMLFPNGIRPTTVFNCTVTCIIIDSRS